MSQTLLAKGITSTVDAGGKRAHILFLDYDETKIFDVHTVACELPGVTMISRSSPGSYHVINTTVRSKVRTESLMYMLGNDELHNRIGYDRNRWTLRLGPKGFDGGDIYRDSPQPLAVYVNDTDREQSAGHIRLIAAAANRAGLFEPRPEAFNLIHGGLEVEQYGTITDDAK